MKAFKSGILQPHILPCDSNVTLIRSRNVANFVLRSISNKLNNNKTFLDPPTTSKSNSRQPQLSTSDTVPHPHLTSISFWFAPGALILSSFVLWLTRGWARPAFLHRRAHAPYPHKPVTARVLHAATADIANSPPT